MSRKPSQIHRKFIVTGVHNIYSTSDLFKRMLYLHAFIFYIFSLQFTNIMHQYGFRWICSSPKIFVQLQHTKYKKLYFVANAWNPWTRWGPCVTGPNIQTRSRTCNRGQSLRCKGPPRDKRQCVTTGNTGIKLTYNCVVYYFILTLKYISFIIKEVSNISGNILTVVKRTILKCVM